MTSAIVGLIGAALGALTALFGSALSERRQARHEAATWRRDQRAAAYDGVFHALTKAASYRHKIPAGGTPDEALLQQWFDDLVEVQYRLRLLTAHCHRPGGGTSLPVAVQQMNTALALLGVGDLTKAADAADETAELIARCARIDMGNEPAAAWR
ncbi:hypothetical protein ABZ923_15235 [Streptomyces sp. NPDC046881]|uniref:hypothetical protein n=1 Tax=Streptomyces sp. NPDC046881 TaxID=3155374 RepID=UPI0034107B2B